eukprot:m.128974 g.128974  ORF g.128974 m.128974 type:complete len:672 (+) comp19917_c0_seq1:71-2086(+)
MALVFFCPFSKPVWSSLGSQYVQYKENPMLTKNFQHGTKFFFVSPTMAAAARWLLLALLVVLYSVGLLTWHVIALLVLLRGAAQLVLAPLHPEPLPESSDRNLITDRFDISKVPQNVDYVIVGGGMAGLSCAAVLGRMGKTVVVLEQHDRLGGGSHEYELEGFKFDAGLHYTVARSGELLQLAGGLDRSPVVFDRLTTYPVYDECKARPEEAAAIFDVVHIGDRAPFSFKHGEAHLPELYAMFPQEKAALDEYIRISNIMLKNTPVFFASRILPWGLQKLVWRWWLPEFAKYAGMSAQAVVSGLTSNLHLRSLLLSLWIDTGARPDTATFFLSCSTLRGLPIESGAYPRGGSSQLARSMVAVIHRHGGSALVRARVEGILCQPRAAGGFAAAGVYLEDGTEIAARCGVVSTVGYLNTVQKLLPQRVCQQLNIPRTLPFGQSAGFVMCNLGIRGSAKELKIPSANRWYLPATEDGDILEPMHAYFDAAETADLPVMMTFPSAKDQSYEQLHPDRTSCQMLAMAPYSWFERWRDTSSGNRGEEYEAFKRTWLQRCLCILYRFYPQLEGRVVFSDVSTPLSIEHYLATPGGGAVGLDPSPLRYNGDLEVLHTLDVVTPVHGLYMSGQDTLLCGVVLAQLLGIITACRMLGFFRTLQFFLQSIFFPVKWVAKEAA